MAMNGLVRPTSEAVVVALILLTTIIIAITIVITITTIKVMIQVMRVTHANMSTIFNNYITMTLIRRPLGGLKGMGYPPFALKAVHPPYPLPTGAQVFCYPGDGGGLARRRGARPYNHFCLQMGYTGLLEVAMHLLRPCIVSVSYCWSPP